MIGLYCLTLTRLSLEHPTLTHTIRILQALLPALPPCPARSLPSPQGQSLLFSGTTCTSKAGKTRVASLSKQLCTMTAALYLATKR